MVVRPIADSIRSVAHRARLAARDGRGVRHHGRRNCARYLGRSSTEPIRLPEAEHMIDDLDRIMTAFGTISIKTPDVWGQDRLAKFRSEYEVADGRLAQARLQERHQCRRSAQRVEATQVQVGANVDPSPLAEGLDRTPRPHDEHRSISIDIQVAGRA